MSYRRDDTMRGYRTEPVNDLTLEFLYELILNMKLDNRDFYDNAVDGRVIAPYSVGADHLELHSITVDFLNVEELSAISADLGIVEAGELTGVNIYGSRFETLDDATGANITLEGGSFLSSVTEEDEFDSIHQRDTLINQGSITQFELSTLDEEIQQIYMSFYEPGKLELSFETGENSYFFRLIQDEVKTILTASELEIDALVSFIQSFTVEGIDIIEKLNDLDTRISDLEGV